MSKEYLFIDGRRSGYSPDQCEPTVTVGRLIAGLHRAIEDGVIDEDTPVYISNDSGYTYGEIDGFCFGQTWRGGEEYDIAPDFYGDDEDEDEEDY